MPRLERINNLNNVPKDIEELILEMYHSIENEVYPSYNAAMLLFRPIIVHIIKYKGHVEFHDMNYGQMIKHLYNNFDISYEAQSRLYDMKNFVNDINHNCEIVLDEDEDLVFEAWDLVKYLVETIFE